MIARRDRRTKKIDVAPALASPVARRWSAWMIFAGATFVAASWIRGANLAYAGLFWGLMGIFGWSRTLPRTWGPSPRNRLSSRLDQSGWSTGRVMLAAAGVLLFVAGATVGGFVGLGVVVAGVVCGVLASPRRALGWSKRRKDVIRRADRPDEPWTWDRDWTAGAERRSFALRLRRRGTFVGAACGLFFVLLCRTPSTPAILVAQFLLGAVATFAAARAWRIVGMGVATLGRVKFPIHPGERAELTFGVSEGGATIEDAQFALRHMRERRDEAVDVGRLPFRDVEIAEADPSPDRTFVAGVDRRVFFDVPADAPGTSITAANPSYWEVRVRGRADGRRYEETFLVPIYARPKAQRGSDVSNAPRPVGTTNDHDRSGDPGTTSVAT